MLYNGSKAKWCGRELSHNKAGKGVTAEMTRTSSVEYVGEPMKSALPQLYIYRWDRQGRKGQTCRVTARGKFNSIRVEFEDGYVMITSGNAIRKAPSPASAMIDRRCDG